MIPDYAELHCTTNFSFLRGASHPEELVERALELGYSALAITDECSLAGVVRAHLQARTTRLPLLIGASFALCDAWPQRPRADGSPADSLASASRLILLASNRNGYGNLAELITTARRRAAKGSYQLWRSDLEAGVADCLALLVPAPALAGALPGEFAALCEQARFLGERFPGSCWLGAELLTRGHDAALLDALRSLGRTSSLPLVAAGDVLFHVRSRKRLQDTLSAIRLNRPLRELGRAVAPNAEQHLRSRLRLARIYPPELLAESVAIAGRCSFSLAELRYEYPREIVPEGRTPGDWLRQLTLEGAALRYPGGTPDAVTAQIGHELALIAELGYEPYFLTVADIVAFARGQGILCQGRGSAANSAVCYCLGITEVDPARMNILFERFISRERDEPPDIDVDFEHQRRDEVIAYLYRKYGRHRAALTATVISYRARSALRDVGKALGIDAQRIDALSRAHQWWADGLEEERLREAGFDPESPVVALWLELTAQLRGFPRHLSQHPGGFVLARESLSRLVPIENAAMAGRSVIEWDKDDLDALGILKVDVLALGMLSAIRRALERIGQRRGAVAGEPAFRIQDIPAEDPETYEMICRADTVGAFQIESRAQMSMLPRLQPRCFYDLVIEVAIVRPGPIQGGMVHPYLRRRQGLEPVAYPREEIRPALARTLGIPIFQEQVMQIAILAAGFTPGEADQLRRGMAAWRRKGGLHVFRDRVVNGMLARGYDLEFAEAIFRQIEGFGEYGFPESHAASFALLVYVSCWIKCHEPAAFLAALLDSQPMGFYAPAQLVRDARAHGVEVRGVDALVSQWESTLEETTVSAPCLRASVDHRPQPAVRLGLNRIHGLSESGARRLLAVRDSRRRERGIAAPVPGEPLLDFPFDSVEDLARACSLGQSDLQALARSDALAALAGHRVQANWEVAAIRPLPELLANARFDESPAVLAEPSEGEGIIADYQSLGIPMGRHPVALLRPLLKRLRICQASSLRDWRSGQIARASGLVTHRQRPQTASGTIFVTIEDETGTVNVIIWPAVFERFRAAVLGASLMSVYGIWQRDSESGAVMHLIARRVVDHSALLGRLATGSRDFR